MSDFRVIFSILFFSILFVVISCEAAFAQSGADYKLLQSIQKTLCNTYKTDQCRRDPDAYRKISSVLIENFVRRNALKWSKEEIDKVVEESNRDTVTPYDVPGERTLLRWLYDRVVKAATSAGVSAPPAPALGSSGAPQVNAFTVTDENSHAILFNGRMIELAERYTLAALRTDNLALTDKGVSVGSGPGIFADRVAKDPKRTVTAFTAWTEHFLDFPVDVAALDDGGDATTLYLLLNIRDGIEVFVMAHEFGHLIMHSGKDVPLDAGKSQSEQTHENSLSWVRELEADLFAITMLQNIELGELKERDVPRDFYVFAPLLYFTCQDVLRRAATVINDGVDRELSSTDDLRTFRHIAEHVLRNNGNAVGTFVVDPTFPEPTTSHPPPALRREFIRKILEGDGRHLSPVAASTIGNLLRLWELATPTFDALNKNGKRVGVLMMN